MCSSFSADFRGVSSFLGPEGLPPLCCRKGTNPYGFVLGKPSILRGPQNQETSINKSSPPPPLLPTRAKRSKSGSFGGDPTSTCLKTVKIR